MDIGCQCEYVEDDANIELYDEKLVKARKGHTCCECGSPIQVGEYYFYSTGRWDGDWDVFKTCVICKKIRKDVCCNVFGELRTAVWEMYGLDYVTNRTIDEANSIPWSRFGL